MKKPEVKKKKVDATHILLVYVAGIDLQGNPRHPTDAQYWSKNSFVNLREDFDAHFEESGLSAKHRVSEADAFTKEQFEELLESEQAIWHQKKSGSTRKAAPVYLR